MTRYVRLAEERAENPLFLNTGLTFPVAFKQLFYVFVVHEKVQGFKGSRV
jgi:hypothetical protein